MIIGCVILKLLDMYTRVVIGAREARKSIAARSSEGLALPPQGHFSQGNLGQENFSRTGKARDYQNGTALPSEAVILAMGQTADTIRRAYARVMEHKATGYFRPESDLPASKGKIKAAIILTAWFYQSQGKLDKAMHDAYQVAYGHLADFVPDELAARSTKEAELTSVIPAMHPGIDPFWLEELKRYHVLGEEYQRLAEQFINLRAEFDQRLEALSDPLKMAGEKMLIQQTLLPGEGQSKR